MFRSIGWPELVLILVVVLLIIGPKRLPEMTRSLGSALREFRSGNREDDKEGDQRSHEQ